MDLNIELFSNSRVNLSNGWVNHTITWDEFVKKLSKPIVQNYTMDYYMTLKNLSSQKTKDAKNKEEEEEIKTARKEIALLKDVGAFIPGKLNGQVRNENNILYRSMIALDIDNTDNNIYSKIESLPYGLFYHTTHSHTKENPRIRVFIPLLKKINTKEEYKIIVEEFCNKYNLNVDIASYKFNQVMFYPAIPSDSEYIYKEIENPLLNPYDYLKDIKVIQKVKSKNAKKTLKEYSTRDNLDLFTLMKDIKSPYDMGEVIGKFCRKYTIPESIEKYLNEVYEPGTQPNCYTYIEGSSMNGLKVYPDTKGNNDVFAYSFHSTDPINDGHCHNAFDLLKVHRFQGDIIKTIKFCKNELGIKESYAVNTNAGHEAYYYKYNLEGKLVLNEGELLLHLLNEHRILVTEVCIFIYLDGVYKEISKNVTCKIISNHLNEKDISANYVNNLFSQLTWNEQTIKTMNKDKMTINFKNKMLRFTKDGNYEELEHDPEFLTTFKLKQNFIKTNEVCFKWKKFINDVLSQEQHKLLQEVMGYMLLPNNSAKKFFALYGVGDSGKSVILKVITRILGEDLVSGVTLQRLAKTDSKFDTSSLYGKLANIVGDLSNSPLQDTSVIKMLTGDDFISAQRKFGNEFQFYNLARLVCSMNQLPPNYNDKTQAFYNRLIIMKFDNAIPKEKQDPDLIDKFDMNLIINWAIEGLQRLLKNNLIFSIGDINKQTLEQYKKDNNNVEQFADEILIGIENFQIPSADVYKYYKIFCKENGYSTLGRNKFISELKNSGYEYSENCYTNKRRFRGFKNIGIKPSIVEEYNII